MTDVVHTFFIQSCTYCKYVMYKILIENVANSLITTRTQFYTHLRHRIRLPREPCAALLEIAPFLRASQTPLGVISRVEIIHWGEFQRQLILRHCDRLVVTNRMCRSFDGTTLAIQRIHFNGEVKKSSIAARVASKSCSRLFPKTSDIP